MFLFVILFGLSMDYHVFILSRIKEGWDRGIGNEAAVEQGIRSSAGVVTAAAAVMVAVFAIFATLSLIDLQQFGVGLAAAVLIDATLIRGVVLPGVHEAARQVELVHAAQPRLGARPSATAPGRGARRAPPRNRDPHPGATRRPAQAGRRRSGRVGLGAPHKAYTAWVKTAPADPSEAPLRALDARALRADFPILAREINGYPLAYLDSASSAQTPRQVLDAMNHVYEHHYANVHRGVYTIAAEATEAYEAARDKVAAFVNARSRRECLFVRNSTEGLNLVAYSYGNAHCGPGDVIVCSEMEHHSNMVPWQLLANRTGASLRYIGVTDDGRLDLDQLAEIEQVGRVKLVAVVHQSNSLGTLNPVREICDWAHERDAIVVVDGAQSAPHRAVDVQAARLRLLRVLGPQAARAERRRRALGPRGAAARTCRRS